MLHPIACHRFDSVPKCFTFLALMLGQTPIFAILTFSKDVLYDTYFYAERIMELNPDRGSKAGGVLMKIANMAVSVGVLASIFYRWTKEPTGCRQSCLRNYHSLDTRSSLSKSISLGRNSDNCRNNSSCLRVCMRNSSVSIFIKLSHAHHQNSSLTNPSPAFWVPIPVAPLLLLPFPRFFQLSNVKLAYFHEIPGQRNFPFSFLRNQFT